ncbi:hypothetical protein E4T56_gene763 [Termitomyces sp. T112]|nr:hypothetical protein E4T56_gene763 [Termitomyces sp. T112]
MKSQTTESGHDQERGRRASSDSDMQGQLGDHENQVSSRGSPSTTAAMDDPQPVPPPASTAPQIRSRITVVCAECKRLKLKCDRRTPCGSCTKRDTVSRCIYSPAAAEKVDLHSINNRLIQVETLLSLITAGKTPPPFQSSYPFAQVPIVSSHSATVRPSRVTSNTASPISIRLDDLVNIWLAHCQLDVFMPGDQASVKSETAQDEPFVKLEQSPVELLHLSDSGSHHEDTIPIDQGPSAGSNDASTTRRSLPSLHLYHTQYQEECSYISQDTYSCDFTASQMLSSDSAPSSKQPSVTPAIFSHLPAPAVRMRLLSSACSTIPHLSLLIHWTRVSELADLGAATPEGDCQRTSANAVFDACSGSRSPSSSPLPSNHAPSLPIFACMCYLLALGALEPPGDVSVDHSFLYALAGQAMGIWEEHRSSKEEEQAEQAEREKENLNHVVALLLQVKYLLRTEPVTPSKILSETVFPLIGKLVNTARGLGLACDPESDAGVRKNEKVEERQRIIWWDIMFYDIFTSDVLGQAPLITLYSYNTRIPAIACCPSYSSSFCNQSDENPDGEHSDSSGERGNEDERRPLFAKANGLSKARTSPRLIPPPQTKTKTKVVPSIPDHENTGFFGVRCRLTRLAQTLNHRLAYPGCDCCSCGSGYTLDQAAKLEAEIRAWVSSLPSSLHLESSSSLEIQSQKHTVIAAELAVLANRMIISAYVPLMRPPHDSVASSSTSVYSAAHPWSPASRATIDAAQSVVRAARVQHRLMRAGNAPSFMYGFYPLQKAVSDALVICAHSGFASTKPGRTVVLVEEVKVALEVLDTIGLPEGEMSRLLASIKRRIESSDVCRKSEENTLKRKHAVFEVLPPVEHPAEVNGQMEVTSLAMDSTNSYVKANDGLSAQPQQSQTHRPVIPPSPQRHSSVPRSHNGNHKKHAKKPLYSGIGFRDRGKDGAPWTMKKVHETKIESPMAEPPVTKFTSSPDMHANSFQPQRLSPIQHPINRPIANNGHRSRSSSLSQTSRLQTSDYPSYPTEKRDEDMHTSQRRRFSTNDASQDQPHQQEQIRQSFIVSSSTPHIRSHQSSRTASYDAPHSFDQPHRSFDQTSTSSDGTYAGPPSPYANSSNGPLSTASSPYGSTGHPQTPVMYSSSNSHHSSPPTFVQHPDVSSPQTYYHMPSGYEAHYEGQAMQQHEMLRTNMMDSPMPSQISSTSDETMITQVSQSLPIYEKTQQHIIYDGETAVELVQQQQMHHYHVASGRVTPADHLAMNASIPQAWATTQYMQSQQSLVEHQDSQYWSTGQTYHS